MADDTEGPWNDYAPPASADDGPWKDFAPAKPSAGDEAAKTFSDVGKTAAGHVLPEAVANIGAGVASAPYLVGSYALQAGTKAGEYLGEGVDEAQRAVRGQPLKSQADYDQEQLDLMNSIRSGMGMAPAKSGDVSGLVPTPSNLLEGGAKAAGVPLYEPQTEAGKVVAQVGDIAGGGVGADMKTATALRSAVGATTFDEVTKRLGLPEAVQFFSSLVGGGIGAKVPDGFVSDLAHDTAVNDQPSPSTKTAKNPQGLGSEDDGIKGSAFVKGANPRTPNELDEAASVIKGNASALYKQSADKGAVLTPEAGQQAVDQITKSLGRISARRHGDTLSVLDDMKAAAQDGSLTLEDLDDFRQDLREVHNDNTDFTGRTNSDGYKASKAIDSLDQFVDGLTQEHLASGDIGAVDALNAGRAIWSQYRKFDAIANIIKQAGGDPNKLKAGLTRFLNKPANTRGFSDDEVSALQNAAQNSTGEKLLKSLGKFGIDLGSSLTPGNTALPAIAGATGMGGAHGIPLVLSGTVARQAQKMLARGKAEHLLSMIEGNAQNIPTPTAPTPAPPAQPVAPAQNYQNMPITSSEGQAAFNKAMGNNDPEAQAAQQATEGLENIARGGHAAGGKIEPTEKQKKAGNYKKEHIFVHGLPVAIENTAGSYRRGKSADGKPWQVKMPVPYGHIKCTEGADGDHVDCFIGPHRKSKKVFVIDQNDHKTGKFDEHKCMIGFATRQQALAAYLKSFSDGKGSDRIGHVSEMQIDDFKKWISEGDTKTPLAA